MDNANLQLRVGALTETGFVRHENQDRMSGDLFPIGHLYIVADGIGGYQEGGLAAELTIAHLREEIGQAAADGPLEDILLAAFNNANKVIYDACHAKEATIEQMGSTAVLLLLSGRIARVAHVGDSRAYLFRNGRLFRLTTDHTRVQRMLESGILNADEAERHPDSHILERAIGIHEEIDVDISDEMAIEDGDAFLLCSDGLSGFLTDAEIESVLNADATAQGISEILVKKALDMGGHDNITVQFIQSGDRQKSTIDGIKIAPNHHMERKSIKRLFILLIPLLTVLLLLAGYIYST